MRTTIAVVVATHDRPARLAQLLRALAEQERPADEVVVVADGSPASTAAVLAAERARGTLPLRMIERRVQGGPATARDDGWRATEAELVAFTDDDCAPTPGWLAAVERAALADPGAFVQGRDAAQPGGARDPWPVLAHDLRGRARPRVPDLQHRLPRGRCSSAIDGFDIATFGREPGGEDCDLAWRAIEAGARPVFAPDALVRHAVDDLGPLGKLRARGALDDADDRLRPPPRAAPAQLPLRDLLEGDPLAALPRPDRARRCRPAGTRCAPGSPYPYLRDVWARGRVEGGGPLLAPYFVLHDLVEVAAVARAAVRTRTPML